MAFASCVLNGHFFVGNIGIHTRPDGCGYRLVFPSKILANGLEVQCAHPVSKEAGELLLQAITSKFEALIAKAQHGKDVASMARQPGGLHGDGSRVP